ncbi:hypothetical protein [Nitrosomonas sp.]|uniref:hypothetical protein n=1 Tax=Nitrosomonas sp. TaxID=42353 RepID=UPI0025D70E06|nr:hypothetical protein [Nitrosomonas sp.]
MNDEAERQQLLEAITNGFIRYPAPKNAARNGTIIGRNKKSWGQVNSRGWQKSYGTLRAFVGI